MKVSYKSLHALIHALNRGEKRVFRKFAKRHVLGEKNLYWELFSAMEKQTEYDSDELETLWGSDQPARRLPVLKNYLLKLILSSLRQQQKGKTLSMYLREQLDYIELLLAKGQGELCARWIKRTRKKAEELGETIALLSLIRWEKRLVRWQAGADMVASMERLVLAEGRCLEDLRAETALQGIRDRMFAIIITRTNPRATEVQQQLESLVDHPLLSTPPEQLSLEGQLAYRFVYAYYFHMHGQYKKLLEQYREMVRIWEAWPSKQKWEEQRYINTLYLYLDSCYQAKEFDEFKAILPKIKHFEPAQIRNQALKFHLLHHLQFRYYLNTGQFEAAIPMEAVIGLGLKKYQHLLNPNITLSFYHNLAILFLILEDYSRGLKWLNQIVHSRHISARQDLQGMSRILRIIFHFELGNYDLMESLLSSSRRYLRQRKELERFEEVLLKGLRLLAGAPLGAHAELWDRLILNMEFVRKDIEIPIAAENEIQAWLQSKKTGEKIADIIRNTP